MANLIVVIGFLTPVVWALAEEAWWEARGLWLDLQFRFIFKKMERNHPSLAAEVKFELPDASWEELIRRLDFRLDQEEEFAQTAPRREA